MSAKKNAPFELPDELQAEFDRVAKEARLSKVACLQLVIRKGLPIVKRFLETGETDTPESAPTVPIERSVA